MKLFKKEFLLSLVLIALIVTLASCSKKKVTLSAEKSEISVVIGDAVDLKLSATEVKKYSEQDILGNLDIKSSDNKVIKVEGNKITAIGIGNAVVTATWKEYASANVSVKVNVIAPEVGEVRYTDVPSVIYVGDKFSILTTKFVDSDSDGLLEERIYTLEYTILSVVERRIISVQLDIVQPEEEHEESEKNSEDIEESNK